MQTTSCFACALVSDSKAACPCRYSVSRSSRRTPSPARRLARACSIRCKKSWIVFEPIVELPRLGLANIPGRIVLDLRERNLIDAGVASCASHESASNLARWEKPSAVYIAVNRTDAQLGVQAPNSRFGSPFSRLEGQKPAVFPCFPPKYRYIPRHLTRKHGSKGRPVAVGP
jgi:hypothetical protein